MKNIILSALIIIGLSAQAQDLPMPSPNSVLEQRVGLTDIKIEYSRPGVKGRTIFGDLVPYGEVWRTGANKVPNITFSTDVKIGDINVEAGAYALLTIPTAVAWTVIINSNTEMWGANDYDESQNVAVVEVMGGEAFPTESFTIDVSDITTNTANITLTWEKTSVKIPLTVEVHPVAISNIEEAIGETDADGLWRVYRNAAGYFYNNKLDMAQALAYMDESIALKQDSWYSYWLKAEILAEQKEYKLATKTAKESMKVGKAAAKESDTEFSYAETIQEGMDKWSKM